MITLGRSFAAAWCLAFAVPQGAFAAADVHAFSVPARPLTEALLQFASQGGISIGAEAARGCRPTGNAVRGRLSVEAGLTRLLAGTGCGFRMVDATTALIVRLPAATLAPRPAPLKSAPAAAPAETTVEGLIVTSAKRSVGLDRAPYAISAVTGVQLSESGETTVEDLAFRLSGLTVTNLGSGRNKLIVRGLSDGVESGHAQSMVGLYFDDARLTYNAPDPDLRLADVDRVELLRGPQGSLYGSGSMGGVLQVISNKPNATAFSGRVQAGAEATEHGGPSGSAEAMVNLPLIRDRVAFRGVAYRETVGGHIDDSGLKLEHVGGSVRQGGRASLAVQISPRWSASLGVIGQTIHANDTHYAQDGLPPRTRALYLREPYDNDFDQTQASLQGDLGWAQVKATLASQTHKTRTVTDASLGLPAFIGRAPQAAAFVQHDEIESFVSELSLASPPGRRFEWLAGVFSSELSEGSRAELTLTASGIGAYNEARADSVDEYAVYGEATWNLTPRLSITGGGRVFELGTETRSTITQPNLGAPSSFQGKTGDRSVSPKAAIRYDWSDRVVLYAQAAEGFRPGGFNTAGLQGGAPAGTPPLRRVQGDELSNVEIGARMAFFDAALRLRLAVFQAHWGDIQTQQVLASGLAYEANVGDGHNTGVEIEAAWRRGGLRVDGALIFNDPELGHPDKAFPGLADIGLPGVAKLSMGAAARYQWPQGAPVQRVVGGEVAYVGASRLPFDGSLTLKMGDYWTTRASAGIVTPIWRLTAYVENLFGGEGDTFAYGNPFSLRAIGQQTPQRPTTWGLVLAREF